jgi:dTDP-4-dehydrorhamnose reductase
MKILIVGSGGQLGLDCTIVLAEHHEVAGVDVPQIDIGDGASISRVLAETEPELILNCAAYTAVDGCETNQETAYRINGEGPRLLAEAAVERGCRLIHISTDYVFDGMRPVPQPYLEHDPVNPLSVYGKSKLMGEQGVAETAPDSLILRTAWLYSAHGANFLKTMLRLALSDPKRNFTIVDDQYGSLTWSHTLARQIERILDTDLTGIVHTTSQGYSTWYEAACYFLGQMEVPHAFVPCTTRDYPTPAHRPANSILQNAVLEKANCSVFEHWQDDVDRIVAAHGSELIRQAKALL